MALAQLRLTELEEAWSTGFTLVAFGGGLAFVVAATLAGGTAAARGRVAVGQESLILRRLVIAAIVLIVAGMAGAAYKAHLLGEVPLFSDDPDLVRGRAFLDVHLPVWSSALTGGFYLGMWCGLAALWRLPAGSSKGKVAGLWLLAGVALFGVALDASRNLVLFAVTVPAIAAYLLARPRRPAARVAWVVVAAGVIALGVGGLFALRLAQGDGAARAYLEREVDRQSPTVRPLVPVYLNAVYPLEAARRVHDAVPRRRAYGLGANSLTSLPAVAFPEGKADYGAFVAGLMRAGEPHQLTWSVAGYQGRLLADLGWRGVVLGSILLGLAFGSLHRWARARTGLVSVAVIAYVAYYSAFMLYDNQLSFTLIALFDLAAIAVVTAYCTGRIGEPVRALRRLARAPDHHIPRSSARAPALLVAASGCLTLGIIMADATRGVRPVHFGWKQGLALVVAGSALVLASLWLARTSARDGASPLRVPRRWRYEPLDYVGALLIPVTALAMSALRFGHTYDDPYITFRYAKNLANGGGFFYNAGEHVLGTTAPGFGILLGVLGVPDPDSIPVIADCIGALSLAGLGLALYAYGRMSDQRLCGLLAALLAVTSPFLLSALGGETPLLLALVAWGFVAYHADRTVPAALLLALATLVRPDGALALVAVGVHYVVARRRLPLREAAIVAAVLGPMLLAAAVTYGSPLPSTLDAKLAQRDSGLWHPFLGQALAWLLGPDAARLLGRQPAVLGSQSSEGVYIALAAIGAAGCLLRRFRFWWLPLAWAGALTLGYAALDVPFYHWYAAPLGMAVAITAATGTTLILQLMWRTASRRVPLERGAALRLAAVAVTATVAVYGFSAAMSQRLAGQRAAAAFWPTPHYRLYLRVSEWLNTNTPKGSSVGYDEIGLIGFRSHSRIVDPFGLVTEGASRYIARRELDGAYRRRLPDYLIFGRVVPVPTAPWFTDRYETVGRLSDGDWKLTIYRRRDATA